MITTAVRFFSLFLTALLVGAMFGIWLGFNPAALSATAYVEMQQNAIRSLNVALPLLGLVSILLTATLAALTRNDRRSRYLLIAAVMCLVSAGLITRFANQPINALVITWAAQTPPSDWAALRDTWWHWHGWRTLAAVAGLALAVLAAVMPPRGRRDLS